MITVRQLLGGRRRPVFTSMRGLGTLPLQVASGAAMNTPAIPRPSIPSLDTSIYDTFAGPGSADSQDAESTESALFVLEAEQDAAAHNEFAMPLRDSEGRLVSVSPTVAPQGDFLKTWGPPLLAVAGIGLAVWILRS